MKYFIILSLFLAAPAFASILPDNGLFELKNGKVRVKENARALYNVNENDRGTRTIKSTAGGYLHLRATNLNINEPRISYVQGNGKNFEIVTRNLKQGGDLERTVECLPSPYRVDGSVWGGKKTQYDCYYASVNTCRRLFSSVATYKADFNQCKNLAQRFKEITGYTSRDEAGVRSYQYALAREMNRLNSFLDDVPEVDKDQLQAGLSLDNISEKQPNAVKFFHDLDNKVDLCLKHFPEQASAKALRQIEQNDSKRATQ